MDGWENLLDFIVKGLRLSVFKFGLNLHHFKHQCFHKLTKMSVYFLKAYYSFKRNQ